MIYQKLHFQLTALFTAVTAGILILMTCLCLLISETNTRASSFTTFTNTINSIIDYLENQPDLSHQWLRETQTRYHLNLDIRDNGRPLFFHALEKENPKAALFSAARSRATAEFEISQTGGIPGNLPTHVEFSMEDEQKQDYYASVITIPLSHGDLEVTAVSSLEPLDAQFTRQRLRFAGAAFLGILLLALFSWFYTGHLLHPLEQNQKNQTAFLAAASHELRSPLTVMLSSLSALKVASATEAPRFYQAIESEGARMSRLIEDMLSLANADNRNWKITPAPAPLDTLLLEAFDKYEPLARKKDIRLDVQLPDENLPLCTCDASRITQLLAILLDNAISYTPPKGRISLGLSYEKEVFHIQVADNGPGIPDAQKEAVFHRFYRADTAHKDREHFGLGLCIAKEISHLHKGDLLILDTPGGGATFTLTLPLS